MRTVFNTAELREIVAQWRRDNERIAFVPTMGNLHDGHIALLQRGRNIAKRTIVSIFVNPIQFGKGEDYATYPSTLKDDQEKLERCGLDVLFAPNLKQLYPGGMEEDTRVSVPALSNILCGKFRPGHFSGVATVVTKLFSTVQPDCALFGEKDLQQLMVIRRMVDDLCIPIEIIGHPIIREADGLAMSSRNSYLNAQERALAPVIYQMLQQARDTILKGNRDFRALEASSMTALANVGFKPEYFSVRNSATLAEASNDDRQIAILTASWLGSARLIDNIQVDLDAPAWAVGLHRAIWLWAIPVPMVIHLLARQIDTSGEFFKRFIESESGVIENATAVLLIPATIIALRLALRYYRVYGLRAGFWFLGLAAVCFGFAGEELSWGQHWWGWQSPEYFAEHNRQGETNFHNLNIHFGRVVKSILTLVIIIGGIVLPLRRRAAQSATFGDLIIPSMICLPAAMFVLGVRVIERLKTWFDIEWTIIAVNLKELQELYIAIFLLIYVLSINVRKDLGRAT